MSIHHSSSQSFSKLIALGALFAALSTAAKAQVNITDVTYTTSSSSSSTTNNGLNFAGDSAAVSTVSAGGVLYNVGGTDASTSVTLVRAGAGSNYSTTIAYQSVNGSSTSTYSSFTSDTSKLLQASNPYAVLVNPFVNVNGGSNVERIDVKFGSATTVGADQGLMFFDYRIEAGDTITIALITGYVSGTDTPIYLTQAVTVTPLSASSRDVLATPTGSGNATYLTEAYTTSKATPTSPEELTFSKDFGQTSARELSGVLVRFSDFGITSNTTILGYSVVSGDVNIGLVVTNGVSTGGDANLLADVTNGAVYPGNTGSSFDFAGFTTAIASPVPEPSTYGALLTAGSLGFYAWRRRRQARAGSQA